MKQRLLTHDTTAALLRQFSPDVDDIAEQYHDASKFARSIIDRQEAGVGILVRSGALLETTSRSRKRYGQLRYTVLPEAEPLDMPVGDALQQRRTASSFDGSTISLGQLASLLGAAYGVTTTFQRPDGNGVVEMRTAPSAGALYPLDLYVIVNNVEGLEPGLYHFDPSERSIARVRAQNEIARYASAFSQTELITSASAVAVVAGTFARNRFKYGLRSYRFTLFEAGHVAQNFLLAATALELRSAVVGGFYDNELEDALGFNGLSESILYVMAVGR